MSRSWKPLIAPDKRVAIMTMVYGFVGFALSQATVRHGGASCGIGYRLQIVMHRIAASRIQVCARSKQFAVVSSYMRIDSACYNRSKLLAALA
jgi:hypothetical protein